MAWQIMTRGQSLATGEKKETLMHAARWVLIIKAVRYSADTSDTDIETSMCFITFRPFSCHWSHFTDDYKKH